MRQEEENGYIEAYQIIEDAYGELVTAEIDPMPSIEELCAEDGWLRAEELLLHASYYVEQQIPRYLRGTY